VLGRGCAAEQAGRAQCGGDKRGGGEGAPYLGELQAEQLLARAAYIIELVMKHTTLLLIHKLLQPRFGFLSRHCDTFYMLTHVLEVLAAFALASCHDLGQFDARLRAQARAQKLYFKREVVLLAWLLHARR
jgi:hypothetical protein